MTLLEWINGLRQQHGIGAPLNARDLNQTALADHVAAAAADGTDVDTGKRLRAAAPSAQALLAETLSGETIVAAITGSHWALHERGTLASIADGELPDSARELMSA